MEPSYFIFRCSNNTYDECINKMLFGQTASMSGFVNRVSKGDILFLHNIHSHTIHGPFIAETNGTTNIDPTAWGGGFPAQVKVKPISIVKSVKTTDANAIGLNYSFQNRYFDFRISSLLGEKLVNLLT